MNKSELIVAFSRETNLPVRKAQEVLDMVFDTMSRALIAGDRIEVRGFGSFSIKKIWRIHRPEPQDWSKNGSKRKEASIFQGGQGATRRNK